MFIFDWNFQLKATSLTIFEGLITQCNVLQTQNILCKSNVFSFGSDSDRTLQDVINEKEDLQLKVWVVLCPCAKRGPFLYESTYHPSGNISRVIFWIKIHSVY